MRDLIRWYAELILRLVPPALRELEVDGVLVDEFLTAGGTAAEHVGVPFVTMSAAMFWNGEPGVPPAYTGWTYSPDRMSEWRNRLGYAGWHWFIRPTLDLINRHRRLWRLSRVHTIDDTYSRLAQIAQLCPALDFPRRRVPDTFHYIGSFTADRQLATDHVFPWDRLDGRPLIFASLGTIPDAANPSLFPRILSACAGLDAQLVLALGKWYDAEKGDSGRDRLGEIPANALVVDFVPQLAILDRASVLITHAGANTVMEALSRAVPMVALPRSADQPAIASRIARSGAGLLGSFWSSTSEEIRGMVERVLAEDEFRARARLLQADMLAAGGCARAADIAERALTTGRAVKRRPRDAPVPRPDEVGDAVTVP